ncbi:unnamed protein product [Owenia fusiformis]|uniref:Uncharacterized protein n=1 Tax=Owenia fusiformis TaxID=6347 RepID=A0A8J1XFN7_OWEFU|nr:unnamed protein product [Owenia fusiformis]
MSHQGRGPGKLGNQVFPAPSDSVVMDSFTPRSTSRSLSGGSRNGSPTTPRRRTRSRSPNHEDNRTLEDARWIGHRRKIGLSQTKKHKSGTIQIIITDEQRQEEMTAFMNDKIKMKECTRYVHDPKNKDTPKCKCGQLEDKHIHSMNNYMAAMLQQQQAGTLTHDMNRMNIMESFQTRHTKQSGDEPDPWTEDDIAEFPTNAFGQIDFIHEDLGGRKPAKFIRLSDKTPMEDVITLLEKHWHMLNPEPPNLVVSVVGGAKNFKLDGRKKEVFNRGLVKAVQSTHGWVITSGCNMGIMKAVGTAIQEGQSFTWGKKMTRVLRCIGIAPWGYIERKEKLISQDGNGKFPASYKVNNSIRKGCPVPLNQNHTHFLLVDDGKRGTYSGVASFRASLEKKISLPVVPKAGGECGLGIPVVMVVVEGGTDAITDACQSLSEGIPVVICVPTGRAADILAYAFKHTKTTNKKRVIKDIHRERLEEKIEEAYKSGWKGGEKEHKEKLNKLMTTVLKCCENENLITVFSLNKNEDLDLAILSALLKGQGASTPEQHLDQLKLALTWNRSDIAADKIFTDDITWPQGMLDDTMTQALLENKIDFVRLLLQNGLVMKEYLTVYRLRNLYNKMPRNCHLKDLLSEITKHKSSMYCLHDVQSLLKTLVKKYHHHLYNNDTMVLVQDERMQATLSYETFHKPFRELFIWAVLMNRLELAKFLWERGDEAVINAIAASAICKSLADRTALYDSDLNDEYLHSQREFEQMACGVLDECYSTDPDKAAILVEREYETWGSMNVLEMAAEANDKKFLSTVCCQNCITIRWKRGIGSDWWRVVLALIFPPLIFCGIRYQPLGNAAESLSPWQKMLMFYRAPMTKFAGNTLLYMLFLLYYSYVILFQLRPTPTIYEWVLIGWIGTMVMEEIREVSSSNADTILGKVKDWWNYSFYNRLDALTIFLFILGVILRIWSHLFDYARHVYVINCVFMYARMMRVYSAHSQLGPKMNMIRRMLREMLFFLVILCVFLFAYGVSSQALLYPARDFYIKIFKDVLYYPYWQIYGEIFLEEISGVKEGCYGNTTMSYVDGEPCPVYSPIVPILLGLYLLMGNVLLLNLLIAIFSRVYEEVEENSIEIWKYDMYFLVCEMDEKPGLSPPFAVFEYIVMIIMFLANKSCCKKRKEGPILTTRLMTELHVYERECCALFISHAAANSGATIENRVKAMKERMDGMYKILEEQSEHHLDVNESHHQHHHAPQTLTRRKSTMQPPLGTISEAPSTSNKKRPFSRWPSIHQVQVLLLKEKLKNHLNMSEEAASRRESNVATEQNANLIPSMQPPTALTGYQSSSSIGQPPANHFIGNPPDPSFGQHSAPSINQYYNQMQYQGHYLNQSQANNQNAKIPEQNFNQPETDKFAQPPFPMMQQQTIWRPIVAPPPVNNQFYGQSQPPSFTNIPNASGRDSPDTATSLFDRTMNLTSTTKVSSPLIRPRPTHSMSKPSSPSIPRDANLDSSLDHRAASDDDITSHRHKSKKQKRKKKKLLSRFLESNSPDSDTVDSPDTPKKSTNQAWSSSSNHGNTSRVVENSPASNIISQNNISATMTRPPNGPQDSLANARILAMEQRLQHIERNTGKSLKNIEGLLRSSLFQKGEPNKPDTAAQHVQSSSDNNVKV